MKRVINNQFPNDVTELKNISECKIYIYKSSSDIWYMIRKQTDKTWIAIDLNSSILYAYSVTDTMESQIKYALDQRYPVYEFDSFKEMVYEINKIFCKEIPF